MELKFKTEIDADDVTWDDTDIFDTCTVHVHWYMELIVCDDGVREIAIGIERITAVLVRTFEALDAEVDEIMIDWDNRDQDVDLIPTVDIKINGCVVPESMTINHADKRAEINFEN
jgi:hypothetical protein